MYDPGCVCVSCMSHDAVNRVSIKPRRTEQLNQLLRNVLNIIHLCRKVYVVVFVTVNVLNIIDHCCNMRVYQSIQECDNRQNHIIQGVTGSAGSVPHQWL